MRWCGRFLCFSAAILAALIAIVAGASRPQAKDLQAIILEEGQQRISIASHAIVFDGQGDSLRVNTAADTDDVRRLMSIRAKERGSNPFWYVFALRNATDKPIIRWLVAARYNIAGSGVIWPDLDSSRIRAVTPSIGFVPQTIDNERADIFQITVPPGQTVTYVAELAAPRARIDLWAPVAYELYIRDRRLFNGIMLGITGLLGIFLTAVFAANHKAIFPSAALVTWSVLAYLCVDFGFWHKLLQLRSEDNAVYRAATEAAMASSLAIFLYTFLRLGAWHSFVRMLALVWIVAALSLVFVAVIDPRLASTFARLSFAGLGVVGGLVMLFLAIRGQDRALSLIPTWLLFLVWLFGAATTLGGQLSGDIVVSSMVAGLTLIVVLLGFTVTQFAFANREPFYDAGPNEQSLRSLAVEGAGAAVWDWNARREEIKVSSVVETMLGLNIGDLSSKVSDFLKHVHPDDQERFRLQLASIQEHGKGVIRTDLRMRQADSSYRWFDLEAASIPASDPRLLRCVGLMRDITDMKRAQDRLMYDAVHDGLTGLPNRELFVDRMGGSLRRALTEVSVQPKIIYIGINKPRDVNASYSFSVGDSLILTLVKRLRSHLNDSDTLARVGDDQFAILIDAPMQAVELQRLADDLQRSIRTPIRIAGHDVVLTGAVGIAISDGHSARDAEDNTLLKDAEVAMYRGKRDTGNQIVFFRQEMRNVPDERAGIANELQQALERKQLEILFQPIIDLPHEELSGFEAVVRWQHPKLGVISQTELVRIAEENGHIIQLGAYTLTRAVEQAAKWQKELPRTVNPLFVSVNISSQKLFRQNLVQEVRHIVGRNLIPDGVLRLEIDETLLMENPEQAIETLEALKHAGARLILDDFGTGFSSLAYLQRFPVDTVKIDRELVVSSGGSETGTAVVRSIIALARELGKHVVAQGVDTSEYSSFLRSIGCEYAQGHYYGEPMPHSKASEVLKAVRKSERKLRRLGLFRSKASSEEAVKSRSSKPAAAVADMERGGEVPVSQAEAENSRPVANTERPQEYVSQPSVPPQQPNAANAPPPLTPRSGATEQRWVEQQPVSQPAASSASRSQPERPQTAGPPRQHAGRRPSPALPENGVPGGSQSSVSDKPHAIPGQSLEGEQSGGRPYAANPSSNLNSSHQHQSHTEGGRDRYQPEGHEVEARQQQQQASTPHARQEPASSANNPGIVPPLPHMVHVPQDMKDDASVPPLPHQSSPQAQTPLHHEGRDMRLPHEMSPDEGQTIGRSMPAAEPVSIPEAFDANEIDGPEVLMPDLSKLPPGLAASLGRLAGLDDTQIEEVTRPSAVKKDEE